MRGPSVPSDPGRPLSRRAFLAGSLALGGVLVACQKAPPAPATPAATPTAPPTSGATGAPVPTATAGAPVAAPTAPAVTSPTQAASAAPRRGGALVAAIDQDPVSLDPHKDPSFAGVLAYDQVYESLVDFDETMQVVPALAERWETAPDGKSLTFHLRPGATFHDGTPLAAADVKYSLDRALDPKTGCPFRSWIEIVQGVKVVDPATVQLTLAEPYAGLPNALAGLRASAIMPSGLAEKVDLTTRAVGTGPFKLVEYVPGDHVAYARNAAYWDPALPYLENLTFKVMADESARLAAIEAGQVQYAPLTAVTAKQVNDPTRVTLVKGPVALLNLTYVNVSVSPLDDRRVRKALRLAVDPSELIAQEALGAGVPTGPIPTGFDGWALDPAKLPYLKPDLAGAKQLLAAAGHPDGKDLTLTVTVTPQVASTVTRANVLRTAFKRIGVDLQVRSLDYPSFVQAFQQTDFELLGSGNGFRPDPDGYISPFYSSAGPLNAGAYSNPDLDRLIAQARTTADLHQRQSLYARIQTTLLDDSPSFWWYTQLGLEALAATVKGYVPSFMGRRQFLKKTWVANA